MSKETGKISLLTAAIMNIGVMVGAGIYVNTQLMAQKAGHLSYLGWLLTGLIILPVVLGISRISMLVPGAGGLYGYSKAGINQTTGFISGWLYFIGYVGTGAALLSALRGVLAEQVGFTFATENVIIFNLIFMAALCLLNFFSVDLMGKIQSLLTTIKLLPLVLVCLIFALYWDSSILSIPADFSAASLFDTVAFAVFGFWGFEVCCNISHLIVDSKRNASRAILLGFGATLAIYVLFHFGILHIMGSKSLAALGAPALPSFLTTSYPVVANFAKVLLTISFIVAFFSVSYGSLIADSFLLQALAKEKLLIFSSYVSRTNRAGQPIVAVVIYGIFTFLLASFIEDTKILVPMTNLGILGAYALSLLALLVIKSKEKRAFDNVIALAGLAACGLFAYYSSVAIGEIKYMYPFIIMIAAGVIMYFVKDRLPKSFS